MRAAGLLAKRRSVDLLAVPGRAVLRQRCYRATLAERFHHMTEPRAKRPRTDEANIETDQAWRQRLRIIATSPAAGDGLSAQDTAAKTTRSLGSADSDTDLCCPFAEKDQVRALGAQFDWERKVWFVPEGVDLQPFARWLPADAPSAAPEWHGYPNRRKAAARLRILSWNIAELIPSKAAPEEWGANSQLRGVRAVVRAERPDVLLLQECPCRDFELDVEGFVRCGSTESHCGFICTYVRRDFKRTPAAAVDPLVEPAQVVAFPELPAVGVLLSLEDVGTLCVVNCHLAPHGPGAVARAEQVAAVGAALSGTPGVAAPDAVVLAGDSNMRNHEVEPNGRRFGSFGFPLRHCRYEGHRYELRLL